jgi:phosphohistidine phosphatase SixA/8-oxo-dGTP pyrophosphatase MutT (NUDIX family)
MSAHEIRPPITAAGAVVWRSRTSASRPEPRTEVLLVHRPEYDDWTFPKGKSDPGELLHHTAVREVAEETGIHVRLGIRLPDVEYQVNKRHKVVSYWLAQATSAPATEFTPNDEVDEIRWVRIKHARDLLTYAHDQAVLDQFRALHKAQAHKSRTLIVVRHAKASPRDEDLDDLLRPLTEAGHARAAQLRDLLAPFGVRKVISSPALRCTQTLEPYADQVGAFLEIDDRLGEDTKASAVQRAVTGLTDVKKPVALCSHRPTMPWIQESLGIDFVDLAPGEAIVVHHRRTKITGTEVVRR